MSEELTSSEKSGVQKNKKINHKKIKLDIDIVGNLCYNHSDEKYLVILKGEWYGFDLD